MRSGVGAARVGKAAWAGLDIERRKATRRGPRRRAAGRREWRRAGAFRGWGAGWGILPAWCGV
jgi:hypothetical protein